MSRWPFDTLRALCALRSSFGLQPQRRTSRLSVAENCPCQQATSAMDMLVGFTSFAITLFSPSGYVMSHLKEFKKQ